MVTLTINALAVNLATDDMTAPRKIPLLPVSGQQGDCI